ncbi:MAG: DUF4936 family protein [Pseudomonadota bacterium]
MRELFVYYRVRPADAAMASIAAHAMQAQLRIRHPELIARLLCRPDSGGGEQTWMETYAADPARAPEGIGAALQAAIDEAALALQPWLVGPRHTEVFVACA